MTDTTKPSKEKVHDWMQERQESTEPPPSNEEVRRQLGWDLVRSEKEKEERS